VNPSLAHILDDLPETIVDADEKDDMAEAEEEAHEKEKGSLESENGKQAKEEGVSVVSESVVVAGEGDEQLPSRPSSNSHVSSQDEVDIMINKAIGKLKLDSSKLNDKPMYSGEALF